MSSFGQLVELSSHSTSFKMATRLEPGRWSPRHSQTIAVSWPEAVTVTKLTRPFKFPHCQGGAAAAAWQRLRRSRPPGPALRPCPESAALATGGAGHGPSHGGIRPGQGELVRECLWDSDLDSPAGGTGIIP